METESAMENYVLKRKACTPPGILVVRVDPADTLGADGAVGHGPCVPDDVLQALGVLLIVIHVKRVVQRVVCVLEKGMI